jgi:Cd2+/Zn2+-exporting ATPase
VSLAGRSDHSVSQAIAEQATEDDLPSKRLAGLSALPGRGVQGSIDSKPFYLGHHRLVEELGLCPAELETTLERLECPGKSAVVLCDENRALALFAMAGTVKASSCKAIEKLHALEVRTSMLTGGTPRTPPPSRKKSVSTRSSATCCQSTG